MQKAKPSSQAPTNRDVYMYECEYSIHLASIFRLEPSSIGNITLLLASVKHANAVCRVYAKFHPIMHSKRRTIERQKKRRS
jgi:hypothetical protein